MPSLGRLVDDFIDGTEGRTRTDTLFPELDFESSASTSSATPAQQLALVICSLRAIFELQEAAVKNV